MDPNATRWTLTEAAGQWGVKLSTARVWRDQGRLPGVEKVGRQWLVPAGTARPVPLAPGEATRRRAQGEFTPPPGRAIPKKRIRLPRGKRRKGRLIGSVADSQE